jgi:hypothetical protein
MNYLINALNESFIKRCKMIFYNMKIIINVKIPIKG